MNFAADHAPGAAALVPPSSTSFIAANVDTAEGGFSSDSWCRRGNGARFDGAPLASGLQRPASELGQSGDMHALSMIKRSATQMAPVFAEEMDADMKRFRRGDIETAIAATDHWNHPHPLSHRPSGFQQASSTAHSSLNHVDRYPDGGYEPPERRLLPPASHPPAEDVALRAPPPWCESYSGAYIPPPAFNDHHRRPNDCEIIVIDKCITLYAEHVERRLKAAGLVVDMLFPRHASSIHRIMDEMSSRGVLYAVIMHPDNERVRTLSVSILSSRPPQEHRNIPLDSAIALIVDNFSIARSGADPIHPHPDIHPPPHPDVHPPPHPDINPVTHPLPPPPGYSHPPPSCQQQERSAGAVVVGSVEASSAPTHELLLPPPPAAILTLMEFVRVNRLLSVLEYDQLIKYLEDRRTQQMQPTQPDRPQQLPPAQLDRPQQQEQPPGVDRPQQQLRSDDRPQQQHSLGNDRPQQQEPALNADRPQQRQLWDDGRPQQQQAWGRPQQHQPPNMDCPQQHQPPNVDRPQQHQPPNMDRPQQHQTPNMDRPQQHQPPNVDRPQQHQPPNMDRPQQHQPPNMDRLQQHEPLSSNDRPQQHQPPNMDRPRYQPQNVGRPQHQTRNIDRPQHQPPNIVRPQHQPPNIVRPQQYQPQNIVRPQQHQPQNMLRPQQHEPPSSNDRPQQQHPSRSNPFARSQTHQLSNIDRPQQHETRPNLACQPSSVDRPQPDFLAPMNNTGDNASDVRTTSARAHQTLPTQSAQTMRHNAAPSQTPQHASAGPPTAPRHYPPARGAPSQYVSSPRGPRGPPPTSGWQQRGGIGACGPPRRRFPMPSQRPNMSYGRQL